MSDDKLEEIREWFCGAETTVSARDVFRIKWLLDEIGRLRRLFFAVQQLYSVLNDVQKEMTDRLEKRMKKAEIEAVQAKRMLENAIGDN